LLIRRKKERGEKISWMRAFAKARNRKKDQRGRRGEQQQGAGRKGRRVDVEQRKGGKRFLGQAAREVTKTTERRREGEIGEEKRKRRY